MMRTTTAEGHIGGAFLRRMILLLAAAAVVASMAVATAASPASAAQPRYTCINETTGQTVTDVLPGARHIYVQQGFICGRPVS